MSWHPESFEAPPLLTSYLLNRSSVRFAFPSIRLLLFMFTLRRAKATTTLFMLAAVEEAFGGLPQTEDFPSRSGPCMNFNKCWIAKRVMFTKMFILREKVASSLQS